MTDTSLTLNELMGEGMLSAPVNASSGDNTVIAAVEGKVIRVHQLAIKASADATLLFENGLNGDALTGIIPIYAAPTSVVSLLTVTGDGGAFFPFSPMGWFWTSANTLLNLAVTGGDVDGVIGYSLRDI